MMRFVRYLTGLAASLFVSLAAFADVYLVTDIDVDVTAASAAQARAEAFSQAKVKGANMLLDRLTTYKDRAEAGLVMNREVADRLVAAVDVQSEKQSGTRYLGALSIKFDAAAVTTYLDVFDLPYVDSQDARALILPNPGPGVEAAEWVGAWYGRSSSNTLAPWIGGEVAYPSMSDWDLVADDVLRAGAGRGVLVSASASGGYYYVRMRDLRAGQEAPRLIGSAGPFNTLQEARQGVSSYLEGDWKARTIVRADGETIVYAIARFASRAGWIEIEKALKTSRLVRHVQIENVSGQGADLNFTFIGTPDQLGVDLRAGGVLLTADQSGWVLQSALGR